MYTHSFDTSDAKQTPQHKHNGFSHLGKRSKVRSQHERSEFTLTWDESCGHLSTRFARAGADYPTYNITSILILNFMEMLNIMKLETKLRTQKVTNKKIFVLTYIIIIITIKVNNYTTRKMILFLIYLLDFNIAETGCV